MYFPLRIDRSFFFLPPDMERENQCHKRSERLRAIRCKPCNKYNMFKVLQPLKQAFTKRPRPSGPQTGLPGMPEAYVLLLA